MFNRNFVSQPWLLLLSLAAFGVSPAFAQDSAYKADLDTAFQAFKTRKYDLIKPLLDSNVKIGSLPQGMNDMVVPQILAQLPVPDSYTIKNEVKEGTSTRVNTVYTFPQVGDSRQSFVFDANHKITAFDLPEFVKAEAKAQPAKLSDPHREMPDRLEVPFELDNNLIYVTAELNGKEEKFLLDSGAPSLLLDASHLDAASLKNTNAGASGVGGTVNMQACHIDSFKWQGLKWSDFDSMVLPTTPHTGNNDVAGIIGYDVFKDYEMTFDYDRKVISLMRTDDKGEPVEKLALKTEGVKVVPFKMHQHIPVFPMSVAGKTYQMGLDCGAGANLLYAKYAPDFQKDVARDKNKQPVKALVAGVGKNMDKSELAIVKKATVGKTSYWKMPFVFTEGSLDQLNQGTDTKVDGLLGYEFLKQFITTVNYKKGTLSIYTKGI